MTAPPRQEHLRKGWCPGALRPVAAKDGLLVRLRFTGGILPAAAAAALADLAERCGNALFDLTARANLQMRGVREAALPALYDGLKSLGVIDADADAEAVRNVIASPLAGLRDGLDIRPLTTALETRLVQDTSLHALPGKFGFLIDDGSAPTLATIDADVRFDWEDGRFAIGLGGTRADAVWIGTCDPSELVTKSAAIAHGFIALAARTPEARRMRDLPRAALLPLAGEGGPRVSEGRMRDRAADPAVDRWEARPLIRPDFVGPPSPASGRRGVAHLAAPFGRLDGTMLRAAARLAQTSRGELRLTPWRAILVPGASAPRPPLPGFVTDPADPRLNIAACVGRDGCARGTRPTHADAAVLAGSLDAKPDDGIVLHVSGCTKGCAKPSSTPITIVAREGRYDVVRDGRAGDPPWRRGLDLDGVRAVLASAKEPA